MPAVRSDVKSVINRSASRQYVLDVARSTGRGDVIRQIGSEFHRALELHVRDWIAARVHQHPSALHTLR